MKSGGTVDVPITVTAGGKPLPLPTPRSEPAVWRLTPEQYFKGVPSRYRDLDRFAVHRTLHVNLDAPSRQEIRVYEVKAGALVWNHEGEEMGPGTPLPGPGGGRAAASAASFLLSASRSERKRGPHILEEVLGAPV